MNPALLATIISAGASGVQAVTRGGPKRQYKWNKKAAEDTNRMNRENQEWLFEQERKLQEEQRQYDSPAAQMQRYLEAGLNPHLIYGNGGSPGGTFPIHAPGLPGVNVDAPSAAYPDIAGSFLTASQSLAALEYTRQRTRESVQTEAVKEMQVKIQQANPMLNPQVASTVANSLQAVAQAKANEAHQMWVHHTVYDKDGNVSDSYMLGQRKIEAEVQSMWKKLGLLDADLQLKNEILQSKEFENALKEIQVRWMRDGDITPAHVWQGILMILKGMMP